MLTNALVVPTDVVVLNTLERHLLLNIYRQLNLEWSIQSPDNFADRNYSTHDSPPICSQVDRQCATFTSRVLNHQSSLINLLEFFGMPLNSLSVGILNSLEYRQIPLNNIEILLNSIEFALILLNYLNSVEIFWIHLSSLETSWSDRKVYLKSLWFAWISLNSLELSWIRFDLCCYLLICLELF